MPVGLIRLQTRLFGLTGCFFDSEALARWSDFAAGSAPAAWLHASTRTTIIQAEFPTLGMDLFISSALPLDRTFAANGR